MAEIGSAQKMRDNRKYERTKLYLPGEIFGPGNTQAAECKVLNLSPGGAGVQCAVEFPIGASLILLVQNFGRFPCRVVRCSNGELGMEFSIGEAKQGRLMEMLKSFARDGVAGIMRRRGNQRVPSLVTGNIIRENGEHLVCDVLDVSLEGVSLGTNVRPPLGEIVNLGRSFGRVVRHHDDGIAIQYVKARA